MTADSSTARTVIVNTSPLLYLHQAGCLLLLRTLYGRIVVPPAVCDELRVGAAQGVDVPVPENESWIEVRAVSSPALVPAVVDLGRGEAEVIALGIDLQSTASLEEVLLILDDQLGRRFADLYSLKCTGTLGVIVKAKQQGHIPAVRPLIQIMRAKGLWISEAVFNAVVKMAGE